jgi:dTDP-glucose 4,6-dehydratase
LLKYIYILGFFLCISLILLKRQIIKTFSILIYNIKVMTDSESKSTNENTFDDADMVLLGTGCCGFIGSAFCNYWFSKNNLKLFINLDAMHYCANENNIKKEIRNSPKYLFVKGNTGNADLVTHILNTYKVTHVIHFAARSYVGDSFENSLAFTQDNIVGTHVLLECMRKYGKIVKAIIVDSDESFGESRKHILEEKKTEESKLAPTTPYAVSKAAAGLIAQTYYHSFKMPLVITRGNNVFGSLYNISAQYPEKLIPKFIKLLKEGKKLTIEGDGSAMRAFLHIYDTVRAFEIILKNGKIGNIYNIGCDEDAEYSVLEVARILIRMIKKTEDYEQWIEYISDRPYQDARYYITNQKLKDLGWNITIKFEDGLRDMINLV